MCHDETRNASDTAQLAIFVHWVNKDVITEEIGATNLEPTQFECDNSVRSNVFCFQL